MQFGADISVPHVTTWSDIVDTLKGYSRNFIMYFYVKKKENNNILFLLNTHVFQPHARLVGRFSVTKYYKNWNISAQTKTFFLCSLLKSPLRAEV